MKAKKLLYYGIGIFLLLSIVLGTHRTESPRKEPVQLIQEKTVSVENVVKNVAVKKPEVVKKQPEKLPIKASKPVREYSWQKTVRGNMEEWTYQAK